MQGKVTKKDKRILIDYTGYLDKSTKNGGITYGDTVRWVGRVVPFVLLHDFKQTLGTVKILPNGMAELTLRKGILVSVFRQISKLKNSSDREVSLSMIHIPGKLRELLHIAYVPGDGARRGAKIIRK